MTAGQAAVLETVFAAVIVAGALLFSVLRIIRAARSRRPSCCSGHRNKQGNCGCHE
jgi:hypothetical protein